jgi:hypothetical protein
MAFVLFSVLDGLSFRFFLIFLNFLSLDFLFQLLVGNRENRVFCGVDIFAACNCNSSTRTSI